MNKKHAVISLSGGMDSTCLLMKLLSEGYDVKAYSFFYGQKHSIELKKVKKNIKFLQEKGFPVTHQIINLEDVFSESASCLNKSNNMKVPEGHYQDENMKSTVVENRNIIFSSIIYGKALSLANRINENVDITLGLHAGDHCFTEDTKIMTIDGLKTVKELNLGDKVMSFNFRENSGGVWQYKQVTDIVPKGTPEKIIHITLPDGEDIKLTDEHKVYVLSFNNIPKDEKLSSPQKYIKLVPAKDISLNDYVVQPLRHDSANPSNEETSSIKFAKIASIEIEINEKQVYDITVEDNHNFTAGSKGSILISNSIYPDCRPESQEMAKELFRISNWGSERVNYIAPFINIDKSHVLMEGVKAMQALNFTNKDIKTVLKNTHTCYSPNDKGESCGKCGSCQERKEAFELAAKELKLRFLKKDVIKYIK